MELLFLGVQSFGVVLGAAGLIFLGMELQQIRKRFQTGVLRVLVEREYDCCHKYAGWPGNSPGGYAIYVFRNGCWNLEQDFSASGFVAMPPDPKLKGSYENEAITTQSTPSGRAK